MIVADIIRFTAKGLLLAQEVRNVFYYVVLAADVGITVLDAAIDFGNQVMLDILPMQSPAMVWSEILGENVTDEIGVGIAPFVQLGTDLSPGGVLPSYSAAGISLGVASRLTRPGSKRVAGIGEDRASQNLYVPDGSSADDFALAMVNDVNVLGPGLLTAVLGPVVVGRLPSGGLDLLRVNPITSSTVAALMTTQNTRKERA